MCVHAGFAGEAGEEIQAFLEELVVVFEGMAEEGVAFGEGPPAEDGFGAARGEGVEGGEALEDADRIVGGEHGDGSAELDPAGAAGDGGEQDLGRGDREIGAVVFAQADEIDAEFVGVDGLFHHLAQGDVHRLKPAVGAVGDVAEGIEAEGGGHGGAPVGGRIGGKGRGQKCGGAGADVRGCKCLGTQH